MSMTPVVTGRVGSRAVDTVRTHGECSCTELSLCAWLHACVKLRAASIRDADDEFFDSSVLASDNGVEQARVDAVCATNWCLTRRRLP